MQEQTERERKVVGTYSFISQNGVHAMLGNVSKYTPSLSLMVANYIVLVCCPRIDELRPNHSKDGMMDDGQVVRPESRHAWYNLLSL